MNEERYNRLEQKIDNLNTLIVSVTRTEEKIANLEKNTVKFIEKYDADNDRLLKVEMQCTEFATVHSNVKKTMWGLISAAIVGAVTMLFGRD